MSIYLNPRDIDVIILCGGLGTRLRSAVNDRPKVMADIKGRPFLDILVGYVSSFKFRRFILCVGYMKEFIRDYFEKKHTDLDILFSEEQEPLGTAGALKNAGPKIMSSPFLVLNGDSLCAIDLRAFLNFHTAKEALASIALVAPEDDADYGAVVVDKALRITGFYEKAKADTEGFINAGVYLFSKEILEMIPEKMNYSLEYQLFPGILGKGIYGYATEGRLTDIGTPERYELASKFIDAR